MEGNMRKFTTYLVMVLVVMGLIGCAGPKPLPETSEGKIPSWFLNVPEDPNYLYGTGTGTSRDMSLAIDKASTDARAKIARTVEVRVMSMQKKFDQEVGIGDDAELLQMFTQATKVVTSTALSGSRVKQQDVQKDGNNWRGYVLMEYPIGAANQALLQQLKNNQNMYTRFRESQTFKDLESEVDKFEEWKKAQ